ncbi:MAG: hypothetical protein ACRCTF_09120 [Bacteroidales bacterium]
MVNSKRMDINTRSDSKYTNPIFFPLLIIGAIFGVVFYDLFKLDWIDEILTFLLVIIFVYEYIYGRVKVIKPLIVVFLVSLFYLFYSFKISSNLPYAIISDYIVQVKPYLAFFCTLLLAPILTPKQKQIIRFLCWAIFIYLTIISLSGVSSINYCFSHPSRFATTAVVTSFLFLYASNWSLKTVFIVILFLSIGLASTRAKFVGFFVLMSFFLLWRLYGNRFQFNPKQLLLVLFIFSISIWFAWDKIDFYFISGAFDHDEAFARPALYLGAIRILFDYIPFGSGFASYATYFSAVYYSDIYYDYQLNNFWGLSEDFSAFIADTYYPALAQFGFVGIILFSYFWVYIYKQIKCFEISKFSLPFTSVVYLGIAFFTIESVADSTFTHNRGVLVLMIMALSISELRDLFLADRFISK